MSLAVVYILGGLLFLIAGGEVLLRGAVGLATSFKLTPAVIGLTVVAAGTSVPELAVSAVAAWQGKTDITVGNVVGSNIFNITVILGLVSIYRVLALSGNTIKLEYPVLLAVTILFAFLVQDQELGRFEGVLFLTLYIAFTVFLVRNVKKQLNKKEEEEFRDEVLEISDESRTGKMPSIKSSSLLTVAGICLLGIGAEFTVRGAVTIGQFFQLSERIIGLTIVGAGTGLPEVVTSFVSAYRGRGDVAIANVIGSNLFNILGILGITAVISPLHISAGIVSSDNLWLIASTVILFPIMFTGFKISRWEGLILTSIYVTYVSLLILK